MSETILIIGKNGKTGSRVTQQLDALGIHTRAVSRSSLYGFDWEDKTTWELALAGVNSAYITFQPDLAIPAAEECIKEFVQLAKQYSLKHLVLLSGRGEEGAQKAEHILQQSGLDWNVIRASWFNQNFSEGFMVEGIMNGELFLPAGDVVEPFIDVDDIADIAVATLTNHKLRNRLFEVTGPRAMTFQQCVNEISKAMDRPIKYTTIPTDDFIQSMREQNFPEDMQWLMRKLFTDVLDGRNSVVTNGVKDALGRPATDFQQYIKKVISSGSWHIN